MGHHQHREHKVPLLVPANVIIHSRKIHMTSRKKNRKRLRRNFDKRGRTGSRAEERSTSRRLTPGAALTGPDSLQWSSAAMSSLRILIRGSGQQRGASKLQHEGYEGHETTFETVRLLREGNADTILPFRALCHENVALARPAFDQTHTSAHRANRFSGDHGVFSEGSLISTANPATEDECS